MSMRTSSGNQADLAGRRECKSGGTPGPGYPAYKERNVSSTSNLVLASPQAADSFSSPFCIAL